TTVARRRAFICALTNIEKFIFAAATGPNRRRRLFLVSYADIGNPLIAYRVAVY
ncbi:MAG: hypothetical protein JWQ61_4230, partial [Collimonas fungivorans]|nr:hypothetical protein [Collimonas fungivorans]